MKERLKSYIRYFRSQKTNGDVKNFIQKNKAKSVDYEKNIWSKNWYWDYYIQRHPNSEKSKFYVPYDYFVYKIQPKLNDYRYSLFVDDKNMYDRIFKGMGVRLPKTLFRCYNGIFMDDEYNSIDDIETFIETIQEDVFVKQSIDTQGGKGVDKFIYYDKALRKIQNGQKITSNYLIKTFGLNFIVQEEVLQHEQLKILHPSSLNSIRVNSYRSVKDNKIHILMSSIRIGNNSSIVDNLSSGGLGVGIQVDQDLNASLMELSYVPFSNKSYATHPDTQIRFLNHSIPNFPLIVSSVKRLSNLIPHQRIMAWDFTIDKNGDPVLIELNRMGGIWASQESNGVPFFGEFSEEVHHYIINE